ncbi:MAG: DUF4292 domain-containing protein [Bacteroidetes bacterium]|nr:DUF4292 domain-containing protein [Bacteroidota bacterium]
MKKILVLAATAVVLFTSCRSTKKIQTAIANSHKDSVVVIAPATNPKEDSVNFIRDTYTQLTGHHINFTSFSAKINVDYSDGNKNYNVNATLRMYKDSAIWISVNAIFGIEALRAFITKDSVKILDKQNKTYTARSVEYLKDVTALPLDLSTLQDLLIGNPVFLDSNITAYSKTANVISLINIGDWFKNLVTLDDQKKLLLHSKLDDVDDTRSRTCDLTYSDYENKSGIDFSTGRQISIIATKSKLDITLNFKQYDFNEPLNFPFSIPKNYKRK